jgi:Protein of unknown function (DUF4242)
MWRSCRPRSVEGVPRYLVERTFEEGLGIPTTEAGALSCLAVVEKNGESGVTWLHSYVTEDRRKSFCVYDGPSPEAIRETASRNGFPVDRITPIRVLDPYFHVYEP